MKKTVLCILIALLALAAPGCSKYSSHYKAVGFVHSNERDAAFMTFYRFEGTMTFTLRHEPPCTLKWSASLESGSATVYYDNGSGKTALVSVGADEALDGVSALPDGETVYIIVETDGGCENGAFDFSLD